jgi:Flp pilus assembly CpaE family ATPase
VFSTGGGEVLAKSMSVPFLGRIPLDPRLTVACDQGKSLHELLTNPQSLKALKDFVQQLLEKESTPSPVHANQSDDNNRSSPLNLKPNPPSNHNS